MSENINISKLKNHNSVNAVFLAIQKHNEVSSCDFYAFVKKDEKLQQVIKTEGFVGKNGIKDPFDRSEGDFTTPSGMYSFGMIFGIKDAPTDLKKNYKKLDTDDYWDGDIKSDTYNQYVKGSEMPAEWNRSASEHLIDYKDSYNFAVQIKFNENPIVKGKGSAIFLHCTRQGSTSSAGCIAIPEEKMIDVLKIIDEDSLVVIVKSAEELKNYFET